MTTGIKGDPFAVAIVGDQNSDQEKSMERIRGSTRRAVGACRVQLVIVGICLGTCGYALAQAASTGPDEVGIGIEEITVVSSKKAADELLRETPAAITAFDENRIELALAEDLPDIGRLVPNASLHLASTFTGFPNFYIRGIGVGGSTRTVGGGIRRWVYSWTACTSAMAPRPRWRRSTWRLWKCCAGRKEPCLAATSRAAPSSRTAKAPPERWARKSGSRWATITASI